MPNHYEAVLMSYLAYEVEAAKGYHKKKKNSRTFQKIIKSYTKEWFKDNPDRQLNILFCKEESFSVPKRRTLAFEYASYLHEKGWAILCEMIETSFYNSYVAIAFYNMKKEEIVVAHRGTTVYINNMLDLPSNLHDDIEMLKGDVGVTPKILHYAICFIVRVLTMREGDARLSGFKFSQTGHSLGAVVAEFCAAYIASPKPLDDLDVAFRLSKKNIPVFRLTAAKHGASEAVVFDSLGSVPLLNKYKINSDVEGVIGYVVAPNVANTANDKVGELRCLPEEGSTEDLGDIDTSFSIDLSKANVIANLNKVLNDKQTHSIEIFIKHFNSDSGEANSYKVVTNWPKAKNTFKDGTSSNIYQSSSFLHTFGRYAVHKATGNLIEFNHECRGEVCYQKKN